MEHGETDDILILKTFHIRMFGSGREAAVQSFVDVEILDICLGWLE